MLPGRRPPPHPRIASLWQSIHGVVGDIAASGTHTLSEPLVFSHETLARGVFPVEESNFGIAEKKRREALLKKIVKLCSVAPFGDGAQTRTDRAVRDALQLRAGEGGFSLRGFDPASSGVLAEVQRSLAPNDPQPLRAEFYGLNVYKAGGHFASHKDTPRGDGMIGTLVVLLPLSFSGGELVLRHRGIEQWYFERTRSIFRQSEDGNALRWVAFFGDVDHRIEKVWEGLRATLTWTLHRDPGAAARPSLEGTTRDRLSAALRDAVADATFYPDGATLGWLCAHRYARLLDAPLSSEPLDERSVLALHGRDQLVALAALDAGLEVEFRPFLTETSAHQAWPLRRPIASKDEALFRKARLKGSELETRLVLDRRIAPEDGAFVSLDDLADPWIAPPPKMREGDADEETPLWTLVGETEFSSTDYFGNESCPALFYSAAMLAIRVPNVSSSARGVRVATPA